jgi:phosphoribosylanthranilate isomerase
MVKIKICGITTYDDALACADAGADMLGFNFFKKSPRFIDQAKAVEICVALRKKLGAKCPVLVGVFANDIVSNISAITNKVGLNAAQLSGDESVQMMTELRGMGFKSIQPMNKAMALDDAQYYAPQFPTNEKLPSILLDAHHPNLYGGTGEQASDEVALAVKEKVPRLMLAGGLTPENVAERVKAVQPWGVDVASGVEPEGKPGVKDMAKVKAFIKAAEG